MAATAFVLLSLAWCALLGTDHAALAFSTSRRPLVAAPTRPSRTRSSVHGTRLRMTSSFFADATEPKTPEAKVQVDANGKVFSPGTPVAVPPNRSVKAFQVPKSSFGTFDPSSGEFIPQDEANATRGTSCLVLPEGLRGTVKKVYNTNEWDRAHPILVGFDAGMDREGGGGFDVPRPFTMHFDADEIEVLEE